MFEEQSQDDDSDEDAATGCCGGSKPWPENPNAPWTKGHCKDIYCIVLFAIFWCAMIAVAIVGFTLGSYHRVIYATDFDGQTCGTTSGGDTVESTCPRGMTCPQDLSKRTRIAYPRMGMDMVASMASGFDTTDPVGSVKNLKMYGICVNEVRRRVARGVCRLSLVPLPRPPPSPSRFMVRENTRSCPFLTLSHSSNPNPSLLFSALRSVSISATTTANQFTSQRRRQHRRLKTRNAKLFKTATPRCGTMAWVASPQAVSLVLARSLPSACRRSALILWGTAGLIRSTRNRSCALPRIPLPFPFSTRATHPLLSTSRALFAFSPQLPLHSGVLGNGFQRQGLHPSGQRR